MTTVKLLDGVEGRILTWCPCAIDAMRPEPPMTGWGIVGAGSMLGGAIPDHLRASTRNQLDIMLKNTYTCATDRRTSGRLINKYRHTDEQGDSWQGGINYMYYNVQLNANENPNKIRGLKRKILRSAFSIPKIWCPLLIFILLLVSNIASPLFHENLRRGSTWYVNSH